LIFCPTPNTQHPSPKNSQSYLGLYKLTTDNRQPTTTILFIDKTIFITQHFPIINIFIPLPRKFVANSDSRNGMDFYCFIFEDQQPIDKRQKNQ
jgi:hypothetical protein